jgi:hypothetical protein
MSAFDRSGRFEHELPDILAAIAVPRVPDYYDDLLAQAAATSQRPRWTFLERWPGMDAITYRVAVPSFPWRPFVVAALLLIVALAALLVAAPAAALDELAGPGTLVRIVVDGTINPAVAAHVHDAIAREEHPRALAHEAQLQIDGRHGAQNGAAGT